MKSHFSSASLATSALLLSALPSQAIDCTKAASLVETTICADAQLKWQDDAISRNYFAALKALRGRGNKASHDLIQAEQRRWLSRREACGLLAAGGLTDCVETQTRVRLSELPTDLDAPEEVPRVGLKLGSEILTWKTIDGRRTLTHRGRVVIEERYILRNYPPFMVDDRWKSGDTDAVLIEEGGVASGDCAFFAVVESRSSGVVTRHELGEECVGTPYSRPIRDAEGFAFISPASPLAEGTIRQWRANTGQIVESSTQFRPEPGSTMKSLATGQKPEIVEPLRNAEFFSAVSRLSAQNKMQVIEALWDITNGCETCNLEHPELYGVAIDQETIAYSGCSWFWRGGHFFCGRTDALAVWDRVGGGFYFAMDEHLDDGRHGDKARVEPPLASWPAPAHARYESWRRGKGWTADAAR
ncbi:lysozyme inhibitor LprI family protein [Methylocystis hirsuta]|uniref:lysozyme inhibitor LprI family protein n=1 Tax=Methylocystis hirsuta TaxID=369798 RepID=UPI001474E660|nr:lysozyme inhibitor LprI family protein [Methylocystis hirsuta]